VNYRTSDRLEHREHRRYVGGLTAHHDRQGAFHGALIAPASWRRQVGGLIVEKSITREPGWAFPKARAGPARTSRTWGRVGQHRWPRRGLAQPPRRRWRPSARQTRETRQLGPHPGCAGHFEPGPAQIRRHGHPHRPHPDEGGPVNRQFLWGRPQLRAFAQPSTYRSATARAWSRRPMPSWSSSAVMIKGGAT
jgi:hypothetical protein